MFDNLKELCLLNGTSGNEDAVREYIINEIKDYAEYHIDNLGNIIAFKKGKKVPQKKIMLDAHMDEVALIVTSIQSDGTLTVDTVGGVDASVVIGRQVIVGRHSPAVRILCWNSLLFLPALLQNILPEQVSRSLHGWAVSTTCVLALKMQMTLRSM